jgi:type II secretory pathway predicted ATPase ExeA
MDFLNYWGLREKPFENTGSIKYFYYSPTHKEALVRLIYVIKNNKAGALLAGDYGTGKTTIARELLSEIDQNDRYCSVFLSNPLLTSKELLQEIAFQLGINVSGKSRLLLRRNIGDRLIEIADSGNHAVIVVDEAHLLSRKDVLEELRLFMNLHHRDRFLTSIIMLGQLELRDVINAMPQFKQRFAMYYVLKRLDEEETFKYIKHRLNIAGAERAIIEPEAAKLIYLSSEGRPRQVNNICDMALLVGSMRKSDTIGPELVREVVKDLGEEI